MSVHWELVGAAITAAVIFGAVIRTRRGSSQSNTFDLEEVFHLRLGAQAHLPDAWLQLEARPGEKEPVLVLNRGADQVEAPLFKLPIALGRLRVELVEARGTSAQLRGVELPPAEEDFLKIPSFLEGESALTPLVPKHGWLGVRICAPARINVAQARAAQEADQSPAPLGGQTPLPPKVLVVGRWRAEHAVVREAPKVEWATSASPQLVIVDLDRDSQSTQLVDELFNAHRHRVCGMSISWARAPEVPVGETVEVEGLTIGATFHADIGTVLDLQPGVHRYRVHAELGPYRSQPLEIELVT